MTSLQLLGPGTRAGNLGEGEELAPVALPPWPLQGPSWYVAKPIPGARAAATVAARPWGRAGCWAALEAVPGLGPEAHVVAWGRLFLGGSALEACLAPCYGKFVMHRACRGAAFRLSARPEDARNSMPLCLGVMASEGLKPCARGVWKWVVRITRLPA